jgi:FAD/FMN-containing dehydrogenase
MVLPFGQGRSYGDTCLNDGGTLIDTASLSRFIAFDEAAGILRCEAGTTLADVLELIVPRGWFLPVTPGTKHVTVAGAIANDVHGKNHHRAGTFGRHVRRFELLASSGERCLCSPADNPNLFRATIGGLGLTGLILWAEFGLQPVHGPLIDMEHVRFSALREFFEISEESDRDYAYTVAWIDCLAGGRHLGRGIFFRGNHAVSQAGDRASSRNVKPPRVPFDAPSFLLSPLIMKAFNSAYYHTRGPTRARRTIHYDSFFYPLDAIRDWNRIYGRRGFLQYQCVVPHDHDTVVADLLSRVQRSAQGSFLGVLKRFGFDPPVGMLSFPRPGVTLALDFAYRGARTITLLGQLDEIVQACGGAVYPAKDARMSAASFQAYFPRWKEFSTFVDPKFSSNFWRRVSVEP